jgi:hypothetical protein
MINAVPFAEAPAEWRELLTAVVKIRTPNTGICTGTFISPDWLLTAAHCVTDNVDGAVRQVKLGQISSLDVFREECYEAGAPGSPCDHALVRFPSGTSRANGVIRYPSVDTMFSPETVQQVALAGYGRDDFKKSGRPLFGFNSIAKYKHPFIYLRGRFNTFPSDNETVSQRGDSGGPLFSTDSQRIIATTASGYRREDRYIAKYLTLGTASALALFSQAGVNLEP